jgi:hypothetical protein
MAYTLAGLDHFIQVSLLPDLNKMMPEEIDPCHTVIPSAKNCPEYCKSNNALNFIVARDSDLYEMGNFRQKGGQLHMIFQV